MEQIDVDVRIRVSADCLPIDTENMAQIIADAINTRCQRAELRCDAVEVEGDVMWQNEDVLATL